MSDNRPDAIVKEEQIRASVDAIATGLAADARAAGGLPNVAAIEEFAKQITGGQVKRHEERMAREGLPEKNQPVSSREEYLEKGGAMHFSRPLGQMNWNTSTNQITPDGKIDPRLLGRQATQQDEDEIQAQLEYLRAQPEWKRAPRWRMQLLEQKVRMGHFAKERSGDQKLAERLRMLMALPEWETKIINAYQEGFYKSNGDRSIATDYAMKVVETSVNVFGDWRTPNAPTPKITVG